ncbi:MAG: Na+/H+ antiporter NhaA, partial [Myxococcales bacterium]|nr:Na+/H+ antiporter NhaA [Myxococcales bacterium]
PSEPRLRVRRQPIDRVLRPIQVFSQHKLAGAGLLMLATVAALVMANSPLRATYDHVLHMKVSVLIGGVGLEETLHHWINDGLMGVFFFVVGLEIKRELLAGELSTLRKATLPAIAALGGMVVPALLYFALNPEPPVSKGWGIPMATDIAFALGVLALLGDRVPLGLRVFLTALAIVDDIGAVLVIALFYTGSIAWGWLGFGLACVVGSGFLNALGARNPVTYFIVGVAAWVGFLESGVHATIAAILMAFTIPARTRIDGEHFVDRLAFMLERLKKLGLPRDNAMNTSEQQQVFEAMNENIDLASAPLQRIEQALHGMVTFLVLPVFALANAGVTLSGDIGQALTHPLTLGVVLGLFAGKTIGVTGASWLAVKLGLADLPSGVSWGKLLGVGMLAGVGFTMALFVASLAFADPARIELAKIGILAASLLSGGAGFVFLLLVTRPAKA